MKAPALCLAFAIALLCSGASAQWVHTNLQDTIGVNCLAVSDSCLVAGCGSPWWFGPTQDLGGVFFSGDKGMSWTNGGLGDYNVTSLGVNGRSLFAAGPHMRGTTPTTGLLRTTDGGMSWELLLGNSFGSERQVAVIAERLYATTGRFETRVVVSTDNGSSWSSANTPFSGFSEIVETGSSLFAGTEVGVFLSTDNGISWTAVNNGLNDTKVAALAVSGTSLFAGTEGGGVYLSTNNGASWSAVNGGVRAFSGLYGNSVCSLIAFGTVVFAGTTGGVFLTSDSGTNWTDVSTDLLVTQVNDLIVSGTDLFAATSDGVWRRPLSEMITSVDPTADQLPHDFMLHQNYPNPFNPSTTIRYGLPNRSHVTLTVYNALGQQVATLVEGEQEAGFHEAVFDASGLASGVYLYRLQAGDFVQSKKLELVK